MTRVSKAIVCGCLAGLLSTAAMADSPNEALLLKVVQRGDEAAVRRLLRQGADANQADATGTTALHWAAHRDVFKIAKLLVQHGAKADTPNQYGVTPMMPACTNGNAAMLELLLKAGADPNAPLPGGETPLMITARTGKPRAVRVLLAHGAKVNARGKSRTQTALMWAAAEGHVQTVKMLLAAGAARDARSEGGFTAYLFAVREGRTGVVRVLLKAGVNVNQTLPAPRRRSRYRKRTTRPGGTGPSALDLAVSNAHFELASLLLDAGADPNGGRYNRTPLHTITWVRKPGIGSNAPPPRGSGNMDSLELVRKLVKHGANVNARMTSSRGNARTDLNMRGATPFLLAARTADAELMRLLAKLGADPKIPNSDNTTPLIVAAGVGTHAPTEDPGTKSEVVEAVKVALELGNDVNAVDKLGNTAMHGAAYKHVAALVPLLVKHGAKIEIWNRKNKQGWTPLRIAAGVHRGMNFRRSPRTAAAIRKVMIAAGVSTKLEPEKTISGATR